MNTLTTGTLCRYAALAMLLGAMACDGSKDDSASGSDLLGRRGAEGAVCGDEEEEPNDKIFCAVDADCDSDEFCAEGRCKGYDDEEGEEDECADDDDEEGDDDANDDDEEGDDDDANDDDDDDDDDGGNDRIFCTVNADCDSDEVCSNGRCD